MKKAKTNKEFNFKLYAVIVFFSMLTALIVITYSAYTSRYTAFHPEAVAKTYIDTIVQTGDGYNAYKNAVISKNSKYGDYIRKYYMYPVIYREAGYTAQKGTDGLKGYNDESFKGEKTLNDDGSLAGKVIDAMYPYYQQLILENGWDKYDNVFTSYFNKLVEVRKEIFGDDYMSDEVMFTALEANVRTYGENLTGTKDKFDKNTGVQISFKSEGVYQKFYGDDYSFIVNVKDEKDLDLAEYIKGIDKAAFETYGVSTEEIKAAKSFEVDVTCDELVIAQATVNLIQLGRSWYVDNTQTDTSFLYSFYEIA